MGEWISVKDRLPEKCGLAYAWVRDHAEIVRTWPDGSFSMEGPIEYGGTGNLGYCSSYQLNSVTHWMPLPEAPK